METEIKTKPLIVEIDPRDIFVLILKAENVNYETDICGRTLVQWAEDAASGFAYRKVEIQKNDDIITIVKNTVIDKKYCVVIYADTPLLTRNTLEQAISFVASYGHKAAAMPRGWVFETEFVKKSLNIETVDIPNLDQDDFLVAYSLAQIALISTYQRGRINEKHLNNGIHIADPYNVYIDADVTIGKGTRVGPGVVLRGECKIGKNCRITNFVEIKKSIIGDGTKIAHMSYVGDAVVGRNCNIGCGVVFCNYDGRKKNPITVGDGVFIGSNSNLIAPLTLADNAYIAAGSTITQDVPTDSLGIARARQAIKEGWRLLSQSESKQTDNN